MLLLGTGDSLEVHGSIGDVQKSLQDAVRSSPGTLARLEDEDTGAAVYVNPLHVVTLTPVDREPRHP
jgi:hypothetical protein